MFLCIYYLSPQPWYLFNKLLNEFSKYVKFQTDKILDANSNFDKEDILRLGIYFVNFNHTLSYIAFNRILCLDDKLMIHNRYLFPEQTKGSIKSKTFYLCQKSYLFKPVRSLKKKRNCYKKFFKIFSMETKTCIL